MGWTVGAILLGVTIVAGVLLFRLRRPASTVKGEKDIHIRNIYNT